MLQDPHHRHGGLLPRHVVKLFKRSGKLHVTVGYIPTASADDSIINPSSDTPTKYMDYCSSARAAAGI